MLCSCASVALAANAVPKEVLTASQAVVRIIAEYEDGWSTGSGFVVQNDGQGVYIATNHHVVADDPLEIVVLIREEEIIAEIKSFSEQKDLCILSLPYAPDVPALPLRTENAVQGDAVYAVGFPSAADTFSDTIPHTSEAATITDGIVSAVRSTIVSDYGATAELLQITAPINPGNSGGPLFDETGCVVGVNTYSVEESQGIFGAICASELANFLQMNGITPLAPANTASHLWIILAAGAVVLLLLAGIVIAARAKKKRRQQAAQPVYVECEDGSCLRVVRDEDETAATVTPIKPKKEKKKLSGKAKILVAAIAVVLLLGAAAGGYFYTFEQAAAHAEAGEFSLAKDALLVPVFHDAQFEPYLEAGLLLERGEYEAAREAFEALADYRDSATCALEARYQNAILLMDAGEYETAVAEFEALAEASYKDADTKILEAQCQEAVAVLESESDYISAIEELERLAEMGYQPAETLIPEIKYLCIVSLMEEERHLYAYIRMTKLGDFEGADELKKELTEWIYQEGIKYYRDSDKDSALNHFKQISPYKRSDDYLSLINLSEIDLGTINLSDYRPSSSDNAVDTLIRLIDFEDAKEILIFNYPKVFLLGTWKTSNRDYYFTMHQDGATSYNLPKTGTGKYYYIEEGSYRTYDASAPGDDLHSAITSFLNRTNEREHFRFYIIDKNCIEVYCTSNGQTYTLYRQ